MYCTNGEKCKKECVNERACEKRNVSASFSNELLCADIECGKYAIKQDKNREMQQPPNDKWCVGCNPGNCSGCGT